EETIIARVGEGIVSTIGSSATHALVLENPDAISKTVLSKGLDSGTAFEILSIDIADVDVGENIGAKLQTDQAEADLRVARARAEERRAAAVAAEQEQRANLVAAEAEIPKAMAEAFRSGNLGIMDYYNLRNVEADTRMRNAIGGEEPSQGVQPTVPPNRRRGVRPHAPTHFRPCRRLPNSRPRAWLPSPPPPPSRPRRTSRAPCSRCSGTRPSPRWWPRRRSCSWRRSRRAPPRWG